MATLFPFPSFSFSLFPLPHFRAPPFFFTPPPLPSSAATLAAGYPFRRTPRGSMVAARAGASSSSYVFAIALPLSLLAVTIFASIRIGQKLDQKFFEEMAMNEAIMEANEDDDDGDEDGEDDDNSNDDVGSIVEEEPAISRARNRPKREASSI